MKLCKRIATLALLACAGTAWADVDNFNFNGLDALTPTPFTLTSGGLSATFSSSADPGGFFVISPAGFLSFTDNVLLSPGNGPIGLEIDFSHPITSFTADFAVQGAGPLTLTALQQAGGAVIGTSSAAGSLIDGSFFPEGTIGFSGGGGGFSSIILADNASADVGNAGFALGSFSTASQPATSVPEPSTLALMGLGLAGAMLASRRNRVR